MEPIKQEDLDKYNAKLGVLNKEYGFILASESFIDSTGLIKSRVVVLPKKDVKEEPKK
jgi:hypothetical protein|tara:strand:- start:7051 stop:7224 length:174 start_codon:yes stop_codon:yes gene_type:complete